MTPVDVSTVQDYFKAASNISAILGYEVGIIMCAINTWSYGIGGGLLHMGTNWSNSNTRF